MDVTMRFLVENYPKEEVSRTFLVTRPFRGSVSWLIDY